MALGRHKYVEAARYSMQPRNDVPRSAFDNRWFHKTTFQSSAMIPLYVREILPGDSVRCKMSGLVRLATPIVPVMDNLVLESWFFFCPNRLVWDHWNNFMGEKATPGTTTEYLVPTVPLVAADVTVGSVWDYLGCPKPTGAETYSVVSLPLRMINLIYNEWFRDVAIDDPIAFATGDGPDVTSSYGLPALRKKHDYFTSARPWPQATNNATAIGSGVTSVPGLGMVHPAAGAPVMGIGVGAANAPTVSATSINVSGARTEAVPAYYQTSADDIFVKSYAAGGNYPDVRVLVNDIRTATVVQTMLEKQARGGSRYVETIFNLFGVRSPDARLQRPEFLGGGKSMVTVNPVAQTSATGATGTKLGQLAAAGYVAATDHGFSQSFTEHGFILGFVGIRSDLTYQQGLHRMWSRNSMYDFYWPPFAGLGEQAIFSREIYADGSSADDGVFGYAPRYDEYRWMPSRTSGYMRSTWTTPIDMWHFGEKFASRPALNSTFLADATPITRVLQTTADYTAAFMGDFMFEDRMVRAMPMFGVPGVGARL